MAKFYSPRPWLPEDDARLIELAAAGTPRNQIARALDRTQGSVEGRAAHLGVQLPPTRR